MDAVARLVANDLAKPLGQQIVVDNRSGASGNIGMELVKNAPPDGYTLVLNTMPLVTNQFLYSKVPYDALGDFTPISLISASPSMLTVHPSVPVKSVKDLIALAKSQPGKLNYGTAGLATNPHICGELFNYLAKTNIVPVHFKGGGPALIATMSGETESRSRISRRRCRRPVRPSEGARRHEPEALASRSRYPHDGGSRCSRL